MERPHREVADGAAAGGIAAATDRGNRGKTVGRSERDGPRAPPPGFPQPVVPRPSHWETPETSPSPLLSRMSRRRSAALRLAAAGRWGRRHRRGRGVAAGGVRPGGKGEKGRLFFLSIERHIAAQQHGERLQRSVALHQRPQIGQCGRNVG
jgi:hypothetical protein